MSFQYACKSSNRSCSDLSHCERVFPFSYIASSYTLPAAMVFLSIFRLVLIAALTTALPMDKANDPLEQPNHHAVCLPLISTPVPSLANCVSGHADLTWLRRP